MGATARKIRQAKPAPPEPATRIIQISTATFKRLRALVAGSGKSADQIICDLMDAQKPGQ